MTQRSYEGPPLDGTVQHFAERPYGDDDGETVDVVEADGDAGEETVEDVPIPGSGRPDVDGQSTWDDWEGSA